MAAAAPLQSLKEEATCSICLEYFTRPVSVECGHAFCLSCITQCWEALEANFPCPQCRKTSQNKTLRPYRQLGNMVEMLKQLHLPNTTPQEENLCREHEEKLKLFCEDDQRPICVVCRESKGHRAHTVLPIPEAALEYKDKLYSQMEHLKKELKEMQEWGEEESRKASELEGNIMKQRESILSTFVHLKQFLEKEKQQLLSRLEKEQEEKMKKIQEKLTRLEKQQSTHRSLITELERKCQQQDVDLLKVRGNQKSIELAQQSTHRGLIPEIEQRCQQQDRELLKKQDEAFVNMYKQNSSKVKNSKLPFRTNFAVWDSKSHNPKSTGMKKMAEDQCRPEGCEECLEQKHFLQKWIGDT
ncbi:E3 ubiquitin-protein ligase TRIM39-like [Ambystoma mexicanum]|uniref:E3 ubiquitin-protein ligase TRIM39-like n=1 Tax=Ambystoma mexicanum TaxID=8296 RepID=UPI0037E78186